MQNYKIHRVDALVAVVLAPRILGILVHWVALHRMHLVELGGSVLVHRVALPWIHLRELGGGVLIHQVALTQMPLRELGGGVLVHQAQPDASRGTWWRRTCPSGCPEGNDILYSLIICKESCTHIQGDQAACLKPPVDIDLKLRFSIRFLYQNATFTTMSTGGFGQAA